MLTGVAENQKGEEGHHDGSEDGHDQGFPESPFDCRAVPESQDEGGHPEDDCVEDRVEDHDLLGAPPGHAIHDFLHGSHRPVSFPRPRRRYWS